MQLRARYNQVCTCHRGRAREQVPKRRDRNRGSQHAAASPFPPFDQHSIASTAVPAFAGFYFAFDPPLYGQINSALLTLQALVVLINASIAWLLLQDRPPPGNLSLQSATLIATGVNLVVMALFPPFKSIYAMTNAALPTFDAFYFIFNHPPHHAIVTNLLFIEVAFILVNGALFWLLFNNWSPLSERDDATALARLGDQAWK
jgi:hypothetical protein